MCENCQQLKAELSELLPRLEKIEQTNRDLVELQSVAEKLHANEVQKLQARNVQLGRELITLLDEIERVFLGRDEWDHWCEYVQHARTALTARSEGAR